MKALLSTTEKISTILKMTIKTLLTGDYITQLMEAQEKMAWFRRSHLTLENNFNTYATSKSHIMKKTEGKALKK
jgi:hypothetical protein